MNSERVYRRTVYRIVGLLSMPWVLYLTLYAAGVIQWRLFARVVELRSAAPEPLLFIVIMWLLCLAAMWHSIPWVAITDDCITYRGVFRRIQIRWQDVPYVRVPRNWAPMIVKSDRARICLDYCFDNFTELKASVLQHVEDARQAAASRSPPREDSAGKSG